MDIIMRLLVLSLCGHAQSAPLGRLLQRRRDAFEVYASEFAREYRPFVYAAIPLHAPVPVLRVLTRAPLERPERPVRDAHAAPSAHRAAYARPYAAAHYSEPARQYAESIRPYAEPPSPPPPQIRQFAEPSRQYSESIRPYDPVRHLYADGPHSERDYYGSYETRELPLRVYYHRKPRRHVPYEYAADFDSYSYQPPPAPAPVPLRVEPSPPPRLTYVAPYDAYSSREAAPTVLYARPSPAGGFTYRRVAAAGSTPANRAPLKDKEREKEQPYIIKIHKYRIVKDDLI